MDNYEDVALCSEFKCWVQRMPKDPKADYSQTLHPVFTVSTARNFWKYYQHMQRPSLLNENDNIYLFKSLVPPLWEAPENKEGGRLKFRLRKEKGNRQWEDLQLCFISPDNKYIDDMNGMRLKVKQKLDEVEVWLPKLKSERIDQIGDYIRKTVFADDDRVVIDFKSWSY